MHPIVSMQQIQPIDLNGDCQCCIVCEELNVVKLFLNKLIEMTLFEHAPFNVLCGWVFLEVGGWQNISILTGHFFLFEH